MNVGARSPARLRVVLAIAGVNEEVTVGTGGNQPSVNQDENLNTIRVDRAALDNLPTLGGDVLGALAPFLDPAAAGTGGTSIVVDGMETSEVGVSSSAIQEIRINQNPYSAEFARPGRNRFEVVTKPGGSEYHGTFNLLFRDYRLEARNAFARERPPEHRRIFEGFLSGPLGDDKRTSFIVSANRREEDLQAIVFALTPAGSARENFANPQRTTEFSFRVNRQVSARNTISVRYEFLDDRVDGSGVGAFDLPETGFNLTNREHHFYYNQQTQASPNLVNNLSVRTGTHDAFTRSLRSGVPRVVVLDAFTGGSAQADRRDTENHVQITDIMSWARGRHFVKVGVNVPDISRRGSSDRANFEGTYFFSSLEEFAAARPFSFTARRGEPHLVFWQLEYGVFVQDEVRVRQNLSIFGGLRYDWQNYLGDRNNFAPRVSFAYAPGKTTRTILRGGAGLFYERTGQRPIADALRFDGARLRQFIIANPAYPLAADALVNAQPSSLIRFAPNIKAPYTYQHSLAVERQLAQQTSLTVTYTGARGINLFRSRDVNAPVFPTFQRLDPTAGVVRQIESGGYQRSHAVELQLRGQINQFFNGIAQYTLASTRNNTGGINWLPADNYDLRPEYGRADFDERHRFNFVGTLKAGAWLNFGAILTVASGRPYNLTTGRDDNRDTFTLDRPARIRRNTLQGPAQATFDARWSRELYLQPKKRDKGASLTFSIDAFNLLNRVNYTNFVGNLSSPFFGQSVAARPARRMQLSVRFKF